MKRLAVCSSLIPQAARDALEGYGKEVLLLPPHPALPEPVACHPDMIMSYIDGTAFFDKIYSDTYPDVIRRIGAKRVVITEETLGGEYPADCRLNVASGRCAALGHASSSSALRRFIEDSGRDFIEVKQGYACCSTLTANDALITADKGIASSAEKYFNVLLISTRHVVLEPYDSGFIGGASGFDGGSAYFFGDLKSHPDGGRIARHLKAHGAGCVSLTDGELRDFGGIKFIDIE